jgi:hypothetical protein
MDLRYRKHGDRSNVSSGFAQGHLSEELAFELRHSLRTTFPPFRGCLPECFPKQCRAVDTQRSGSCVAVAAVPSKGLGNMQGLHGFQGDIASDNFTMALLPVSLLRTFV